MISVSIIRQFRLLRSAAESTQTEQAAAEVSQSNRSRVRSPEAASVIFQTYPHGRYVSDAKADSSQTFLQVLLRKPVTHWDRDLDLDPAQRRLLFLRCHAGK